MESARPIFLQLRMGTIELADVQSGDFGLPQGAVAGDSNRRRRWVECENAVLTSTLNDTQRAMKGESAASSCLSRDVLPIWDRLCCIWRLLGNQVGLENLARARHRLRAGRWGRCVQGASPRWDDFGGHEGCNEILVLAAGL